MFRDPLRSLENRHGALIRDSRSHFGRTSSDLDSALSKNAQLPSKAKPGDQDEAQNLVRATRCAFLHTALDHVAK